MPNGESDKDKEYDKFVQQYIWMVRPCKEYEDEVKECKAIKGRFHQYFLYGEFLDCSKWSQDASNCKACLSEKKNDACNIIIKNETERRLKRLSGAKQNDVWKKRDKPPPNWNPPLPQFFLDRNKNSILQAKVDEFNEYVLNNEPDKHLSCTIL